MEDRRYLIDAVSRERDWRCSIFVPKRGREIKIVEKGGSAWELVTSRIRRINGDKVRREVCNLEGRSDRISYVILSFFRGLIKIKNGEDSDSFSRNQN